MVVGRRAVVEVRFGPLASKKAVIAPGEALRVGSTDRVHTFGGTSPQTPHSSLVMPHDRSMSGLHFTLTWDGATCHLRDEGSAGGTSLNGAPIAESGVANGDWIRAGDSHFMVYFEASSPAPGAVKGAPTPPLPPVKALAMERLDPLRASLYAIVDASRGRRALQVIRESVDKTRSLYDGTKGEALAEVAPYLVKIDPESALLDRLVGEGWGSGWAVYLTCARPFDEVRRHLRRFLIVEDEETRKKLYFRFYDPSVLRVFIPSCTPLQRSDFFGEITAYWAESKHGEALSFERGG